MGESFGTIIEFGVALAGFSAVAIALSHEPGALAPLDRFRALTLLNCALGAAFGASFVLVGDAFGMGEPALWRFAGGGVLLIYAFCTAVPILLARRMPPDDRSQLSSVLWALSNAGNPLVAAALLANLTGLLGEPGPGPLMASLVWLLFFSAVLFVRMLVDRPGAR
ncbi:MAG: hypothetical protein ACQGVC_05520 [Myxococcota bacterium]